MNWEMAIVLILQEGCYNPLRVLLIVYYYDWINLLHFRSTRTFSLNPYRNLYYLYTKSLIFSTVACNATPARHICYVNYITPFPRNGSLGRL